MMLMVGECEWCKMAGAKVHGCKGNERLNLGRILKGWIGKG